MERFHFIFLLSIFIVFSSCTKDKIDENVSNCESKNYTYFNQVKPIIDETCAYTGCHDGSITSGNFSSYSGMEFTFSSSFVIRTSQNRDMPPNYASGARELTEEQLNILDCWAQNGFPEQ